MHRWIVRICSFAFAVVLCICSTQAVQGIQMGAPFGSTVAFQLNVMSAAKTKDALAQDMAAIGKEVGTTIVKISPNQEKYKTERDVILFSGYLDSDSGPVIKEGEVFWFNQAIKGHVIDYREIDKQTLNGEYFAIEKPGLRDTLDTWAQSNAINIEWDNISPLTSGFPLVGAMVLSATGLLIPACLLLSLAAVSISLQKRWRQQKVELTEGKPYWKVRMESVSENLILLAQGLILGIIISLAYVFSFPEGMAQVTAIISMCTGPVCFFILLVMLAASLLSFFAVPPFKALGIRNNTSKLLRMFALILELSGTTVVIVAIASALATINIQNQALGQIDAYSQIPNATRISLLYTSIENSEAEKDILCDLTQQAEDNNVLMVSLDVNQSISFENQELNGFDHFLIANKTYLDSIGVGVEAAGSDGTLQKLPSTEVPHTVRDMAELWLAQGGNQALAFYRYEGAGMLALGANTGKGGESIICNNPLVLLVDSIATEWDYQGFVQSLLSTGNIFFSDYQSAKEFVNKSDASGLVASIDNMAELTLQALQDFSIVIQVQSFSIVVSLVIVMVMSFQAATSWSVANTKLIFAQRCQGRTLIDIARGKIAGRILVSAIASFLGFLIEVFIVGHNFLNTFLLALVIFALAVLFQITFRCYLASKAFNNISIRR